MDTVANPSTPPSSAAAARLVGAVRTETTLARIALGVVAVHVLDDNFLPQPGTSATTSVS